MKDSEFKVVITIYLSDEQKEQIKTISGFIGFLAKSIGEYNSDKKIQGVTLNNEECNIVIKPVGQVDVCEKI